MRLTIIPDDSFVMINNDGSHKPLDLSTCNITENIHALQWFDTKGWIEFDDPIDPFAPKEPNEIIEVLPQWALNCVQVWESWTPPPPPPRPESQIPITIVPNNTVLEEQNNES
jgi:hypothetical protein